MALFYEAWGRACEVDRVMKSGMLYVWNEREAGLVGWLKWRLGRG